ncbi:MAG TPA: hypothetical protein VFA78_01155 [Chloroflexota bacterium]|nr:hypothetical protein [Chloroflexota bacterium]
MDREIIHHRPRHMDRVIMRRWEMSREIVASPADDPELSARCPNCGCVMMYRGIGRLRNSKLVHVYECVHSHREVHSVSIVISE